jgi:hypothetical protein
MWQICGLPSRSTSSNERFDRIGQCTNEFSLTGVLRRPGKLTVRDWVLSHQSRVVSSENALGDFCSAFPSYAKLGSTHDLKYLKHLNKSIG